MIEIKPSKQNRLCNKCQQMSVTFEGGKERCFSCGEHIGTRLDDIVLDVQMSKSHIYINKMFFFLSA